LKQNVVNKTNRGSGRGTRKRNQKKRNSSARQERAAPDPRGDIPPRPKRTYVTSSVPIPKLTQQCTFRQFVVGTVQSASSSSTVANNYYFTLDSLPNYTALSIWDQYRIDAIRIAFVPQNNAIGLVTNSTASLVDLYCVLDYDDANNLGSTSAALKYDNVIVAAPGESLERTFRPRIAKAAYQSAGFTGYVNEESTWLDTAYHAIQHYGVKIFIPQATNAQTTLQTWDVFIEYFVSFRSLIA